MTTARQVIDYIAWMEHCAYVRSKCDSTETAMAIFNCWKRSASAERGRGVVGYLESGTANAS